VLVMCCQCLGISAYAAQEPRTLESGKPVEREISGGQSHTYQISLAAGQFMRVVVEQRGIDVKLALSIPDDKPLVESDLTGILGLAESLSYEAAAAGTYQLVVHGNGDATQSGAYETRLDVKASATVQDRKRITAESLLNEARRLFDQGLYADAKLSEKLGQGLGIFRELEDRYLQALPLNLMGLAHGGSRQYDKAIEAYEQALSLWRGEKLRAGSFTPLVVDHEVVSLPSASALAIQRAELSGRQPAPRVLADIADPVFDRTDERLTAQMTGAIDEAHPQTVSVNNERTIEHLAEQSDGKASTPARKLVIPRLPYTRLEADQLLALTPRASSFRATDFQASRATVLSSDLGKYRYVHFATHVCSIPNDPVCHRWCSRWWMHKASRRMVSCERTRSTI
jgi:tetratricopeptide (TPR) repeat protein